MAWAEMLKRTFQFDVLDCKNCGGRLKFNATIREFKVAIEVLDSMNLPSQMPRFRPSLGRVPPGESEHYSNSEYNQLPPGW
jgi:hypothetical protein